MAPWRSPPPSEAVLASPALSAFRCGSGGDGSFSLCALSHWWPVIPTETGKPRGLWHAEWPPVTWEGEGMPVAHASMGGHHTPFLVVGTAVRSRALVVEVMISRAQMTSLLGTTALRCGLVTVSVSASSNELFLDLRRWNSSIFSSPKVLENHLRVFHTCRNLHGVTSSSASWLRRERTCCSCHGMTVKPLLRRLS